MSSVLVVETHVHTYPASGCARDTVPAVLARAAEIGVGALCITDHCTLDGYYEALECDAGTGPLLVPGVEATVDDDTSECSFDVLVLADNPRLLVHLDRGGRHLESLDELIPESLPRGRCLLVWAHPTGSLDPQGRPLPVARRLLGMVDALEAVNGKRGDMVALSPALFGAFPGTLLTAGSDAHAAAELGRAAMALPVPDRLTPASVIAGLRRGTARWGRCSPRRAADEVCLGSHGHHEGEPAATGSERGPQ